MINIIGIGEMGCKLADEFAKNDNYDVYKIGIDLPKNKRSRGMKRQPSPEQYEANCPAMKHFLKELAGRSILLVNGGETISAITLRVLEHSRPWACAVVYVEPDRSSLNQTTALQENVAFNVLQEYARSGAIRQLLLFNVQKIEEAMGDVPIIGYEDTINKHIFSSLNLINYFEHSEPVLSVDSESVDYSRIMTISTLSLDDVDEKPFFDLEHIKERMYYCGINENELRNDNKLLSKLKEKIDSLRVPEQRTSYRVYSTTYEEPHLFCVQSSVMIQKRSEGT
jgi:hypothetical protein